MNIITVSQQLDAPFVNHWFFHEVKSWLSVMENPEKYLISTSFAWWPYTAHEI